MAKPKKKSSTSKKKQVGRPKGKIGHRIKGTNVRVIRHDENKDPFEIIIPDKRPDFEEVARDPDDEAAKIKYPPPRKDPIFREVWVEFIDNLTARENFKVGHLRSLEILCDLHVEYEELRKFIRINGRSYKSHGRNGMIWKFYPEVVQLGRVQAQIKEYMKMLGLLLKKDHAGESGGEKDEWD